MTVWLAVVASGIVTYLTRALPLAITTRRTAPAPIRRYLDALPIAIIAALAGAGIAVPDTHPTGGAEVGAACVALAVAAWRRNLLIAVVAGVVAVAALRALGL
ncbi:MAG TPA: AzlD domain-containing protein [Candidatus Limnocylindria bacterium]|jgi:branched-subunit amino acid transport protein|nr:AzlD domain-containing protein [Candidatus Limnocylindria bacterium]